MEKKIISKLEARDNVIKWDLERSPRFDHLTDEEFTKIFNYFGPDSFPEAVRKILTWIFRNFVELSAVHDVDFHFSDGTIKSFNKTLERWKNNGAKMLNMRYPIYKIWLLPFRFIAGFKLDISYEALKTYSWPFYMECKNSYLNRCLEVGLIEYDKNHPEDCR